MISNMTTVDSPNPVTHQLHKIGFRSERDDEYLLDNKRAPVLTSAEKKLKKRTTLTQVLIRSGVFLIFLIIFYYGNGRGLQDEFRTNNTKCLLDRIHQVTESTNRFYSDNLKTRNALIIINSFTIDLTAITIMIFVVLYAKNARIFFSLMLFYGIRGIIQGNFLFGFPERYIFTDPGFPSLLVPYGKTADFYFSGHTGFFFFTCLEFIHQKRVLIAFLTFIGTLVTMYTLIVTRAHYSIGKNGFISDILIGLLWSVYSYKLAYDYKSEMTKFFRLIFCVGFWKKTCNC